MNRELILGVDAGGTKTTAAIANVGSDGEVEVLASATTGAGNPKRVGVEVAFQNVLDAVGTAARTAKVSVPDIRRAMIGMAGAGTKATQTKAIAFLSQQTAIKRLDVIPDYKLVLPAAFPDGGVAVIAGTGSIAHGVQGDRETRVGGHGYLIDDAGSGFWIGQQALRAVVRELDGRGPATALTPALCENFGVSDSQGLVVATHSATIPADKIASLAPLVIAAEADDEVASSILDQAARELSELVAAACRIVGLNAGFSLAVAGSVLTKSDVVRSRLESVLARNGLPPGMVRRVAEPVDGAIQLARAF